MDVLVFAVVSEVVQAEEMQVRRVVPLVGERGGDGDMSLEEYAGSGFVVGEVWESYYSFFSYPQGFLKGQIGFFYLLNRLV